MNGVQYVTDDKGRKVAVQLDLKKHRLLMLYRPEEVLQIRMASFVDNPRLYPKLASSNTASKIGSSRLSSACRHTRP